MNQKSKLRKDNGQFHFNPDTYLNAIRREVPAYDKIQAVIANSSQTIEVRRFLDLGSGTGETALGILKFFPKASAVLVEAQATMIPVLQERFRKFNATICQLDFENDLPEGPFCLSVSAFAIHHLKEAKKIVLFQKIYNSLRPGGLLVFGDVFALEGNRKGPTPINPSHDFPSTKKEVENWLDEVGFISTIAWQDNDLAVFSCKKSV